MQRSVEAFLLSDLPPKAMEPLLTEQIRERRETLFWDYSRSAQRLLFLSELRAVQGLALVTGRQRRLIAYACCAQNGGMFEFNDFYVSPQFRSVDVNTHLMSCCLERLLPIATFITASPELPHLIDTGALPAAPRLSFAAAEVASVARVRW